jgi:DNA polymerase-3 subunit epsilon
MEPTLAELNVLVVDCQATGAAPAGYLLELGWARVGTVASETRACLIALPAGVGIPRAVARITGIDERMVGGGVDAGVVWRALVEEAARLERQPAPTVVHYAKFERPFFRQLAGATAAPLDVVCTHEIACRLLPELPRRGLRALAGYFGRAVGELRRSADHVEATAFVWRELVGRLEAEGVTTWDGLREWLAEPRVATKRRRVWPMPRELRLGLPDAPGVYRMLRTSGDVLYVGKAISLRRRVNSYFRQQAGVPERMLEMLSQARDLSYQVMSTALEAALLEPDEIKRHRTPYNTALAADDRELWFASRDLSERSRRPSESCTLGPFTSAELLDLLAALARGDQAALAGARWDEPSFADGYARFWAGHAELAEDGLVPSRALLRVGTRLWREGRRLREVEDEEAVFRTPEWSPEAVQAWLEWLLLRGAQARRRSVWLTLLLESSLVWREPGDRAARLIVVENGEVVEAASVGDGAVPPVPPGSRRALVSRLDGFTVERLDRMRVLTSELKRLVAGGAPVALRFGAGQVLDGRRVGGALWWI